MYCGIRLLWMQEGTSGNSFPKSNATFKKRLKKKSATGAASSTLKELMSHHRLWDVQQQMADLGTSTGWCHRISKEAVQSSSFTPWDKGHCGAAVRLVRAKPCCSTTKDFRSCWEKKNWTHSLLHSQLHFH